MILYLDTSAWVKLYVSESGSKELRAHTAKAKALAASVVAYPEARAAFARIKAQGISTAAKHRQRLAQLNLDWGNLLRIELVPAVVRSAGDLAEVYGLRGFDSIHLASALWLQEKTSMPLHFAVFDQRLRAAAEQAGLTVVP
ncbi:MAG: type II toxin-antitoxin system VapC family toxin [Sulfuritalea sp.]|nr:type II toxin-antitoxin system VapC family toxin [Sulfuritalea sp.]